MSKKGAYLILSHTHKPVIAGPDKGKIQTHEACEFVDRYKPRHLQSATIIMDALTRTMVKSVRDPEGNRVDYDTIEEHVIRGYADKYKKFLEMVGAAIPEALLLTKEEVEAEIQEAETTEETK